MICPSCEERSTPESYGEPKCCPSCCAYYDKALKLSLARKEAAERNVKEKVAPPVKSQILITSRGAMYCTSCGSVGNSKRHVPGSIFIEIVLWLCFLIPGLIYSIWRYAASKKACRVCSQPTLIPARSPIAQKMLRD